MEKDFSLIDGNYRSLEIGGKRLEFRDAFSVPFRLEGFPYIDAEGRRSRLPLSVAEKCDMAGVYPMSMQGAGEAVRFRTNSSVIGIRGTFLEVFSTNHRAASCGFDLYCGRGPEKEFVGNRVIPAGKETIEALFEIHSDGKMRDFLLYFPLHCRTNTFEIGVEPGCSVLEPTPYSYPRKVLFYGSSITNCAGVTRPGLTFPSRIGRMLDLEPVNMGFSGSCRGELVIADEIAKLDLHAVVMEYDYNAPSAEFLASTHGPFFRHLRELCPELPVLMVSKPDLKKFTSDRKRREIIMKTYMEALSSGDEFVEFIDGETLFDGPFRSDCSADGCHPNDQGTERMAIRIGDRLRRMLPELF